MADQLSDPVDLNPHDDELAFDYIKSSDFRAVFAEGAIGGVTPSGSVHFALYVERNAIPKRQIFEWDAETGTVGELRRQDIRAAIVREMSCDVYLDPVTARELALLILRLVDKSTTDNSHETTP